MIKVPSDQHCAIEVDRFEGPDGPCSRWRIAECDAGWNVTCPDETSAGTFNNLEDALQQSGACEFVPGTALHIRTGPSICPFDLLPALQEWLVDPVGEEAEPADWWEHADLGWVQEHIWSSFASFGFDPARIVVINDLVCGVCTARVGTETRSVRLFILCEDIGLRLRPIFLDLWATVTPDNGYGSAWYRIGEIVPGLEATVFDSGDIDPFVLLNRLTNGPDSAFYEGILLWMSGYISMTPGLEKFDLEVNGSTVTAVFPEEGPYAEAKGWLGPTVLRSKPLEDS